MSIAKRTSVFGIAFCTFLLGTLQCAFPQNVVPAQAADDGEPQPVEARILECLELLDSDRFSQRETATAQLLEIGLPALKYLQGDSQAGYERRLRLRMIRDQIERSQFEETSRAFLLDLAPETDYGLDGWEAYSSTAGDSRPGKMLFLEMLRCQPALAAKIEALTQAKKNNPDQIATLQRDLTAMASGVASEIVEQRRRLREPNIGDVVAVLTATTLIEGRTPVEVNELLDASVHTVPVSSYMRKRGYQQPLRGLYASWIPKTHEAMAFRALYIAMSDDLETGAELARRYLSENYNPNTREMAIACLARFGDQTDVPRLLPLLDDRTVCDEFMKNDLSFFRDRGIDISNDAPPGFQPEDQDEPEQAVKTWMIYRISDLALAAAMLLDAEEPSLVFEQYEPHPIYGFSARSVAIAKDALLVETRDRQIDAWKKAYMAKLNGS